MVNIITMCGSENPTRGPLSSFVDHHDTILLLFFFFLSSLVKCILTLPFHAPYILGDETLYLELSRHILTVQQFSTQGNPYPPGYPLIIIPSQLLLSDFFLSYHGTLVINSFVSSLIVFPAYSIARKFLDRTVSLSLAVFVLLLPMTFLFSFAVMSENLFIPLYLFSCLAILTAFSRNSPVWWAVTGFTLFFLYFTRTTGIAPVAAFAIILIFTAIRSGEPLSYLRTKWPVVASFVFPLFLYIAYTRLTGVRSFDFMTGGIAGYSNGDNGYLEIVLAEMGKNLPGFLTTLGRIFLNEISYYLFAAYFIFIIFAVIGYRYVSEFSESDKQQDFSLLFWYSILTSFGFIGLSSIHLATYYAPEGYTLLMGRYLEPTLPVFSILGTIGYLKYHELPRTRRIPGRYLCAGFILVFSIACLIIPLSYYRWANTLSLYHFIVLQKYPFAFNTNYLIVLFSVMFIMGIVLIVKKNIRLLIGFGILLSAICIIFVYYAGFSAVNQVMSSKLEGSDAIIPYIVSVDQNSLVYFDPDFASTAQGNWLFYRAKWWSDDRITKNITRTENISYFISDKSLPYERVLFIKRVNATLYRNNATEV